ncbi:transcription factor IIA alpha/beta subunit [Armillaria novae-zelandiae]|uniref:Transcription factor IIA alpha/beta subunit n=1 Tax=Armillaria novae-zelandiae TaxID=153914 RepID=A0AA39UFH7_9AGAR|nr:transcription factor IIA alpha/beta subunit [Armillaria novae-zelandiae]
MSNKIVPNVYRAVIDDVIDAIKPEFEEYGVPEDVLAELQRVSLVFFLVHSFCQLWAVTEMGGQSDCVTCRRVRVWTPATSATGPTAASNPITMFSTLCTIVPGHPHYAATPYGVPNVKTEPVDTNRYILAGPPAYALPPLPGPSLSGLRPGLGGQTSILSFPPGPPPVQATNGAPSSGQPAAASATPRKIPQVDGPSDDSDDSASPPPFAPRSQHPSLPQPQSQSSTSSAPNESEAINSDLDDSDTEAEDDTEDGNVGDTDIVFCTYDKVARVKNKWKCILKDGMIHINGKDYLFQKCTGEFEW